MFVFVFVYVKCLSCRKLRFEKTGRAAVYFLRRARDIKAPAKEILFCCVEFGRIVCFTYCGVCLKKVFSIINIFI